ncbi:DUF6415 family natural product biosynthesis protein [Streptomyces roseifaciens]
MGTIRVTLDRLPPAAAVDHLLLRLRGHIQLLLTEVEAKARDSQHRLVRLVVMSARDRLAEEPKSGPSVVRCVYAQELACICRDLLVLALAEPETGQRTLAVAS